MTGFNLSEWAINHRPFVWFLMIGFVAGGVLSYGQLGREEDPSFTIKTMLVQTQWPGATIDDTLLQVTDRLEKKLQETPYIYYLKSFTKPGISTIYVNLLDTTPKSDVPDIWLQVRKKVADVKGNLAARDRRAELQRRIRRCVRHHLCVHRRRLFEARAARLCRKRPHPDPDRQKRRQGAADRRPGPADLSRIRHQAPGRARRQPRRHRPEPARAERGHTFGGRAEQQGEVRGPGFRLVRLGRRFQKHQPLCVRQVLSPRRCRGDQGGLCRPAAADVPLQRRAGDRADDLDGSGRQHSHLRRGDASTRWRRSPPICRSASSSTSSPTRPRWSKCRSTISPSRCGKRSRSSSRSVF